MAVKGRFSRDTEALRRRMAMTRRGRILALQVGLDRAAVTVAVMGHDEWSRWAAYFVEVVYGLLEQSCVCDELRKEFLTEVRDRISLRLALGEW